MRRAFQSNMIPIARIRGSKPVHGLSRSKLLFRTGNQFNFKSLISKELFAVTQRSKI
jgi:hypothetical protein